jgi:hypothetical protein
VKDNDILPAEYLPELLGEEDVPREDWDAI